MSRALFVHANDDFARSLYEREKRPYWSRMLPAVFEQFGYLAVEVADQSALAEEATLQGANVLLIGRLPDAAWTPELIDALVSGRAHAILEGPLPRSVEGALGVETIGKAATEGRIRAADTALTAAATEFGAAPVALIGTMYSRDEQRDPSMDWTRFDVPISATQAEAWRAPTWDAAIWQASEGTDVLAEWQPQGDGEWRPAIVRRGKLVGCCFGLFDFLVRRRSSEPYPSGQFVSAPATIGLDVLLLALIDSVHQSAGLARVRVLPWPAGARFALNVRHDFDRRLPPERVAEVLNRHRRAGTAATWYWRASHFEGRGSRARLRGRIFRSGPLYVATKAMRLVRDEPHHEVALHTERAWAGGDSDRRVVEGFLQRKVRGSSAHGDPTCFRFQGAPNVLWADAQGFEYTELIEQSHLHPHRFVTLSQNGIPRSLDIVCLPKHASFDKSTKPDDTAEEQVRELAERFRSAGGLLQVMNHPDIHVRELFGLLDQLPHSQRLNVTAAEAAKWWRHTHTRGEVSAEARTEGTAGSRLTVEDAVIEELRPDSQRVLRALPFVPSDDPKIRGRESVGFSPQR